MVITISTKQEALDILDNALLRGHYSLDEKTLANLRAVRDFIDHLNILDGK